MQLTLLCATFASLIVTTLLLVGEVSKDTFADKVQRVLVFAIFQPLLITVLMLGVTRLAQTVVGGQ